MRVEERYTTQAAKYDRLLVGKELTDKRIEYYHEMGYYGKGELAGQRKKMVEKQRVKDKKGKKREMTKSQFKSLMKEFLT